MILFIYLFCNYSFKREIYFDTFKDDDDDDDDGNKNLK